MKRMNSSLRLVVAIIIFTMTLICIGLNQQYITAMWNGAIPISKPGVDSNSSHGTAGVKMADARMKTAGMEMTKMKMADAGIKTAGMKMTKITDVGMKMADAGMKIAGPSQSSEIKRFKTTRPKIVVWARPYRNSAWTLPELPNGDGGCDFTQDRSQFDTGDAILFFMKSCSAKDLPDPQKRKSHQSFVWWDYESPWTVRNYYGHKLTDFNNYFNWTMSYRMDSDVIAALWPVPTLDFVLMRQGRFGDMVDKELAQKPTLSQEQFEKEVRHLLSLKERLVAWVVSNCAITLGAKRRMTVVESLENEGKVQVDRFGKCADNPVPESNAIMFKTLSRYKFYLAFENSWHCRDYLTEKTLYNCFVAGVIPVVYGPTRANAAEILPKGSYIHVDDFKSLSELGEYLRYLDGNTTAYMGYFSWWKDPGAQTYPRFGFNFGPGYLPDYPNSYRFTEDHLQDNFQDFQRMGLYHLCRKLKRGDHISTTKTVPDMAAYWYGTESDDCFM